MQAKKGRDNPVCGRDLGNAEICSILTVQPAEKATEYVVL